MRKKHVANLLVLALLIGSFAGCAKEARPNETSTPAAYSTTESETVSPDTSPKPPHSAGSTATTSTPAATTKESKQTTASAATTTPANTTPSTTEFTTRAPLVLEEPPNMPAEAYYARKIHVDGNRVFFIDPVKPCTTRNIDANCCRRKW